MYQATDIEVWNLSPGGTARYGAQRIFNVVGRLRSPETVSSLRYRLNGGAQKPVHFKRSARERGRLFRVGDFNIDTIETPELLAENELTLVLEEHGGKIQRHLIRFHGRPFAQGPPRFTLDLTRARNVEEVAQIIDGHWRITRDDRGERCIRMAEEDAGYDRLLVFGDQAWTTGYEVRARLRVDAWTVLPYHNVGLVFKWNPHLQGDGSHLPTQWSTGLGYYAARCPGLRLRFGVDVHLDEHGRKVGCHVLREKAYSPLRRWAGLLKNELLQFGARPYAQLRPGVPYFFRLLIHPQQYALTVWEQGRDEPPPQLHVSTPPDLLPHGSVGFIAANSAVRIYECEITPTDISTDAARAPGRHRDSDSRDGVLVRSSSE